VHYNYMKIAPNKILLMMFINVQSYLNNYSTKAPIARTNKCSIFVQVFLIGIVTGNKIVIVLVKLQLHISHDLNHPFHSIYSHVYKTIT